MKLVATGTAPVRLKVLVVDAHRSSAELLKDFLELRGHTATLAASSADALQTSVELRPDVVIVDLSPGHAGSYSLTRMIGVMASPRKVRFIATTSFARSGIMLEAAMHGVEFGSLLTKPIAAAALLAAVESES